MTVVSIRIDLDQLTHWEHPLTQMGKPRYSRWCCTTHVYSPPYIRTQNGDRCSKGIEHHDATARLVWLGPKCGQRKRQVSASIDLEPLTSTSFPSIANTTRGILCFTTT
jgi:hypothetical protein